MVTHLVVATLVERSIAFLPHFYHTSLKSPEKRLKTMEGLEIFSRNGNVNSSTVLRMFCRDENFDWGARGRGFKSRRPDFRK